MKKAWKVISSVFFGIIIGIEVIILGLSLISKMMNKTPSLFGHSIYVIASGSMAPSLNVGDIIVGKKVDSKSIVVGDIITYKGEEDSYKGKSITHQVVSIREDGDNLYFTCKGTANPEADPEIRADQIETKFVYKTVVITFCYNILTTPYGFVLLVVIPIGYLITHRIIVIIKEIKEDKKDEKSTKDKQE